MALTPDQLPRVLRARLEAEHGIPVRRSPSRKNTGHAARTSGRCHQCSQAFPSYAAWERHPCAQSGSGRWDLTIGATK